MFVPAGSAGKVAFAVVTVVRVRSGSAAGPYAITYDFTLDSGLGVHVSVTPAADRSALRSARRDGLEAR
jgi:hypothetical protein